jgi:hypothetical protein
MKLAMKAPSMPSMKAIGRRSVTLL